MSYIETVPRIRIKIASAIVDKMYKQGRAIKGIAASLRITEAEVRRLLKEWRGAESEER